MTCEKTGCHIFIMPYQEYAYGDAHTDTYGEVYVFRLVARSFTPLQDVLHYKVMDFDEWWDKDKEVSTLLVPNIRVVNLGYEGKPL